MILQKQKQRKAHNQSLGGAGDKDWPCYSSFLNVLWVAASQSAEKTSPEFCHSERSEESLFLFMGPNRREIPRFARNDKKNYFFRSLFNRDFQTAAILAFRP